MEKLRFGKVKSIQPKVTAKLCLLAFAVCCYGNMLLFRDSWVLTALHGGGLIL